MKINKKNLVIVLSILIFFVCTSYIYINNIDKTIKSDTQEELVIGSYPDIFISMGNRKINLLKAYKNKISKNIFNDTLSILPKDRNLELNFYNNQKEILNISYEIRDEDENLIEKTSLENTVYKQEQFSMKLPIQNLILDNKDYMLKIKVLFGNNVDVTKDIDEVYYYTRIRAYDSDVFLDMINLADDFSLRNFDYEEAKKNTIYLETDGNMANFSLSEVNLKSNFNVLTYNKLNLIPLETRNIRLLSYDGYIGVVSIKSLAKRVESKDRIEYYHINEKFIFRKGEERIYILDYSRKMQEIFEAKEYNFTGSRIAFGINSLEELDSKISDDKRHLSFVSNSNIFVFDSKENKLKKIIYKNPNDNYRYIEDDYSVKILSVDLENLYFLSYGYFREDLAGIGFKLYKYNFESNVLKEILLVNTETTLDELSEDISNNVYLNENKILYLKNRDTFYSFGLNTNEKKIELDSLSSKNFKFDSILGKVAYVENNKLYLKDLDSQEIIEKEFSDNIMVDIVGFVNEDLIISLSDELKYLDKNTKENKAYFKQIQILSKNFEVIKSYEKDNYLSNIRIEDSIIKFDILDRYNYSKVVDIDSIVPSKKINTKEYISYYADDRKIKFYYIETPKKYKASNVKVIKTKKDIKAKPIVEDIDGKFNINVYEVMNKNGRISTYTKFSDAIKKANNELSPIMNFGKKIYYRLETQISHENNIEDILDKELNISESLISLNLRDILYFIGKGNSILAYDNDEKKYIIYAYDKFNISVYDFESNTRYKIGKDDANMKFSLGGNKFYILKK